MADRRKDVASATTSSSLQYEDYNPDDYKFRLGQEVWCLWAGRYYEAKILEIWNKAPQDKKQYYYVHFRKFPKSEDKGVVENNLMAMTKENTKMAQLSNRKQARDIKSRKKTEVAYRELSEQMKKPIHLQTRLVPTLHCLGDITRNTKIVGDKTHQELLEKEKNEIKTIRKRKYNVKERRSKKSKQTINKKENIQSQKWKGVEKDKDPKHGEILPSSSNSRAVEENLAVKTTRSITVGKRKRKINNPETKTSSEVDGKPKKFKRTLPHEKSNDFKDKSVKKDHVDRKSKSTNLNDIDLNLDEEDVIVNRYNAGLKTDDNNISTENNPAGTSILPTESTNNINIDNNTSEDCVGQKSTTSEQLNKNLMPPNNDQNNLIDAEDNAGDNLVLNKANQNNCDSLKTPLLNKATGESSLDGICIKGKLCSTSTPSTSSASSSSVLKNHHDKEVTTSESEEQLINGHVNNINTEDCPVVDESSHEVRNTTNIKNNHPLATGESVLENNLGDEGKSTDENDHKNMEVTTSKPDEQVTLNGQQESYVKSNVCSVVVESILINHNEVTTSISEDQLKLGNGEDFSNSENASVGSETDNTLNTEEQLNDQQELINPIGASVNIDSNCIGRNNLITNVITTNESLTTNESRQGTSTDERYSLNENKNLQNSAMTFKQKKHFTFNEEDSNETDDLVNDETSSDVHNMISSESHPPGVSLAITTDSESNIDDRNSTDENDNFKDDIIISNDAVGQFNMVDNKPSTSAQYSPISEDSINGGSEARRISNSEECNPSETRNSSVTKESSFSQLNYQLQSTSNVFINGLNEVSTSMSGSQLNFTSNSMDRCNPSNATNVTKIMEESHSVERHSLDGQNIYSHEEVTTSHTEQLIKGHPQNCINAMNCAIDSVHRPCCTINEILKKLSPDLGYQIHGVIIRSVQDSENTLDDGQKLAMNETSSSSSNTNSSVTKIFFGSSNASSSSSSIDKSDRHGTNSNIKLENIDNFTGFNVNGSSNCKFYALPNTSKGVDLIFTTTALLSNICGSKTNIEGNKSDFTIKTESSLEVQPNAIAEDNFINPSQPGSLSNDNCIESNDSTTESSSDILKVTNIENQKNDNKGEIICDNHNEEKENAFSSSSIIVAPSNIEQITNEQKGSSSAYNLITNKNIELEKESSSSTVQVTNTDKQTNDNKSEITDDDHNEEKENAFSLSSIIAAPSNIEQITNEQKCSLSTDNLITNKNIELERKSSSSTVQVPNTDKQTNDNNGEITDDDRNGEKENEFLPSPIITAPSSNIEQITNEQKGSSSTNNLITNKNIELERKSSSSTVQVPNTDKQTNDNNGEITDDDRNGEKENEFLPSPIITAPSSNIEQITNEQKGSSSTNNLITNKNIELERKSSSSTVQVPNTDKQTNDNNGEITDDDRNGEKENEFLPSPIITAPSSNIEQITNEQKGSSSTNNLITNKNIELERESSSFTVQVTNTDKQTNDNKGGITDDGHNGEKENECSLPPIITAPSSNIEQITNEQKGSSSTNNLITNKNIELERESSSSTVQVPNTDKQTNDNKGEITDDDRNKEKENELLPSPIITAPSSNIEQRSNEQKGLSVHNYCLTDKKSIDCKRISLSSLEVTDTEKQTKNTEREVTDDNQNGKKEKTFSPSSSTITAAPLNNEQKSYNHKAHSSKYDHRLIIKNKNLNKERSISSSATNKKEKNIDKECRITDDHNEGKESAFSFSPIVSPSIVAPISDPLTDDNRVLKKNNDCKRINTTSLKAANNTEKRTYNECETIDDNKIIKKQKTLSSSSSSSSSKLTVASSSSSKLTVASSSSSSSSNIEHRSKVIKEDDHVKTTAKESRSESKSQSSKDKKMNGHDNDSSKGDDYSRRSKAHKKHKKKKSKDLDVSHSKRDVVPVSDHRQKSDTSDRPKNDDRNVKKEKASLSTTEKDKSKKKHHHHNDDDHAQKRVEVKSSSSSATKTTSDLAKEKSDQVSKGGHVKMAKEPKPYSISKLQLIDIFSKLDDNIIDEKKGPKDVHINKAKKHRKQEHAKPKSTETHSKKEDVATKDHQPNHKTNNELNLNEKRNFDEAVDWSSSVFSVVNEKQINNTKDKFESNLKEKNKDTETIDLSLSAISIVDKRKIIGAPSKTLNNEDDVLKINEHETTQDNETRESQKNQNDETHDNRMQATQENEMHNETPKDIDDNLSPEKDVGDCEPIPKLNNHLTPNENSSCGSANSPTNRIELEEDGKTTDDDDQYVKTRKVTKKKKPKPTELEEDGKTTDDDDQYVKTRKVTKKKKPKPTELEEDGKTTDDDDQYVKTRKVTKKKKPKPTELEEDGKTTDDDDQYVKTRKVTKKKKPKPTEEERKIYKTANDDATYVMRAAKVKANEAIAQMNKQPPKERRNDGGRRFKNGKKKDENEETMTLADYGIHIPLYVKQILTEDRHLIEDDRVIFIVPAKKSVTEILNDYASQNEESMQTLAYVIISFNSTLKLWLLYPLEKIKNSEMLEKYPNKTMSDIYGLPHLLRFIMKLPKLFYIWGGFDHHFIPSVIKFVQGLLVYLVKENIRLTLNDYDNVMPDYYRQTLYMMNQLQAQ